MTVPIYPLEENIRLTKKVVEAAHAVGVSVEGELGTIGGVEDDCQVDDEEAMLANPEEAIRFWEETGVDALAIAVGTAHGMYKGEPKIRFDIIEKVATTSMCPSSFMAVPAFRMKRSAESIALGVGKINVNTENQVACTQRVRELLG